MQATKRNLAVLLCAAAICVGSVAQAQAANPELGDTGQPAGTWAPPAASAEASASASTDGVEGSAETSGDSSPSSSPSGSGAHADVVGKFGIGFFGVLEVPIMGCAGNPDMGGCNPTAIAVSAPTIGLRYWLNETIGIEAALGIGYESGTVTASNGMTSNEQPDPTLWAFALHGAVPIALAYSGNFVFQVVPEMNFGMSSGTFFAAEAANDADVSGLYFQLGGRAGAEIHFGFIGLPQLSLQGTVGLHLTLASRSYTHDASNNEVDASSTGFGTSVQNNPWDIFAGNVSAIYYFMD